MENLPVLGVAMGSAPYRTRRRVRPRTPPVRRNLVIRSGVLRLLTENGYSFRLVRSFVGEVTQSRGPGIVRQ